MKFVGAILAAMILISSCANGGSKKEIKIAYVNWAEGIAMTHLVKAVFEDQGYKVDLLNADVAPIFTSLSRKKADVFLDVWTPVTHGDYLKKYGDKIDILGPVYENARIGLVVPDYVDVNSIDELNGVKDQLDQKIIGIDAGAGIMRATAKALKAYDLDYTLMTSSGPAMTASLKKAIDEKKWVVVTGWRPHWMFSRYDLKMLDDPKEVYGQTEILKAACYKGFQEKDPFAAQLIKNVLFSDDEIGSLMGAIEEGPTTEQAVRQWMKSHKELIDSWIPKTKATEKVAQ